MALEAKEQFLDTCVIFKYKGGRDTALEVEAQLYSNNMS